jgi:hypothetical protein
MKKNELVDIIRTLVKEEVHNALPQLLMEVLAEKMTENSTSILESSKNSNPTTSYKKPQINVGLESPLKQPAAAAPKMFTNNPVLNQVLNETVGGIPLEETASTPTAIDVIKSIPKEALNENKEVAAVANALTRDYSKLLKAVDAKAKAKRPL